MASSRSADGTSWEIGTSAWEIGDSGELHTSILFVDLVSSTDLAAAVGLEEFASFGRAFRATCLEQCRYFFESRTRKRGYERDGRHYEFRVEGDELVVFLHTDRPHDDVYQLICLAIALKCAWLGVAPNAARLASGRPTFEIAAGIHSGPVWATRTDLGFDRSGFAIHLAKRVESASRQGERFRIFVSDPAFKLINRRMRNLLFGPRMVAALKGMAPTIGVYELIDSFVDPSRRMTPEARKTFAETARAALATNTFDLWIHSCLQVSEGAGRDVPSEEAVRLCRQVLNIDPENPVALFYAAEGETGRGNPETARLYLEDLTRSWPTLADGWLVLGRLLLVLGEESEARRCILQARRHGAAIGEEPLPPAGNRAGS